MTYCSVGSFPEDRTVLGEGAKDLRAGGDIETPDSESGVGDSGIHPVVVGGIRRLWVLSPGVI